MKNIFYSVLLFLAHFGFSQDDKIPVGNYKSDVNSTEKVNIYLFDGNKYQISILSGVYEQKNDSIYFRSEADLESNYLLEFLSATSKTNKLKVSFNVDDIYYYGRKIYIGTQSKSASEVEYKTLFEFLNYKEEEEYSNPKLEYVTEIDVPYALYFVTESTSKGSEIEKYIVPNNVSELKIKRNNSVSKNINLTGIYNSTTKELSVGESKRNIIKFKIDNDKIVDTRVKPNEKAVVKNWTYPGKISIEVFDYAVDSTAVYVDSTVPSYTFKLKVEKTLTDALKIAKTQKNRFLVIANNPSDKNSVKDFNNFIKDYETEIGYYMYEKYEIERDRYNFYNATEKDINALKKYGDIKKPSVIILNSDGVMLYHYESKITNDDHNFYTSENFYAELKSANEKVKIDVLFANKKTSLADFEKKLLEVSKLEVSRDYDYDAVVEEVVEEVVPEKRIEVDDVVAVDTAAVVYDNYSLFNKKNAYKFKTTQNQLIAKWEKIIDARLLEKEANSTTVAVIFSELDKIGFNRKLFGLNKSVSNQSDMQSVKYLIKHYKKIISTQQNDSVASNYDYYNLNYLITQVLDRNVDLENNFSKEDKKTAINLYKELVTISSYDSYVSRSYLDALKKAEFTDEYLKEYQNYFSSIVKENANIIEELDNAFKANDEQGIDWKSFKYEFANNANDAAWFVVEKVKDANQIKTAIKWSETSLKIEKNSPYYLDTLAQLYYKNGEREKAIATEQKAIENIKPEDADQTEMYKEVLEKMKNGTY